MKINLIIIISNILLILTTASAQHYFSGALQTDLYFPLLKNKNIGLVVNQTSTIGHTHLVDSLWTEGMKIKMIFAPEHGYRGEADAGEHIENGKDKKTGVTLISLYGENKD